MNILRMIILLTAAVPSISFAQGECSGSNVNIKVPLGLTPSTDSQLLKEGEKNGLCNAKVFVAEKSIAVYRAWNAEKASDLYGVSWHLTQPKGSIQKYRSENGICPEAPPTSAVSSCSLKVGTKVVIGQTKSKKCDGIELPESKSIQVYIQNKSRENILLVENCTPSDKECMLKNTDLPGLCAYKKPDWMK